MPIRNRTTEHTEPTPDSGDTRTMTALEASVRLTLQHFTDRVSVDIRYQQNNKYLVSGATDREFPFVNEDAGQLLRRLLSQALSQEERNIIVEQMSRGWLFATVVER